MDQNYTSNENAPRNFWISFNDEYPSISRKCLNILLLFSMLYLCEARFSTMVDIKTSKRERLENLKVEMHVDLSFIRPNLDRQAHVSH